LYATAQATGPPVCGRSAGKSGDRRYDRRAAWKRVNSRRFISLPVSLAEIKPPLLNRDGKTADQPCDRFQILGVLVLEESGEPLNAFVVAVQRRRVIDWSFGL
jgi:hypothetical protein